MHITPRTLFQLLITLLTLTSYGCGGDDPASAPASAAPKGGSIVIGEARWEVVPALQCAIYGSTVSIAGHAGNEHGTEIVLDWGGPTGIRIGSDGNADHWRAVRETIDLKIEDRTVSGSADFRQGFSNAGKAVNGRFEIRC